MPTLSLPIFDGGRRRANLELSEVRRDIAVAGYEKTIQTAFREVADALSAKHWLAEQLTIQRANLEAQSERARLAQLRYDNGSAAFLEVLDAQRDLLDAQTTTGTGAPCAAVQPGGAVCRARRRHPRRNRRGPGCGLDARFHAINPLRHAEPMTVSPSLKKKLLVAAAAAVVIALAWWGWTRFTDSGPGEGFVNGNGRIEATEIDIATKLPGRIEDILVREGDFVTAGQPLAKMRLETLEAQRDEALAMRQQAEHSVTAAQAQVALREADVTAALGSGWSARVGTGRRATAPDTLQHAVAVREPPRSRNWTMTGRAYGAPRRRSRPAKHRPPLPAPRSRPPRRSLSARRSSVSAATASINRIEADIRDSELRSPRDGRVQVRVAQPGEVLGAGGRVLNLIDLSDVYITFFLPETVAGRVALGSEVRIILDAAPEYVIPATVSFVASAAQFTPKTVETASERQKLMFRVRAQISQELLREHLNQVKTGLPGVAWVKLDANAEWPQNLSVRVPE